MKKQSGNVLVGQSGGPTAVINQSLVGVVETCTASSKVGTVIGSLHGIQGVLAHDLVDLSRETKKNLEAVANTTGSALGSVRHKPTEEECERIVDRLVKLDVRWFFYIGGNDSAETAALLDRMARSRKYELSLFHVPKTIDNDLMVTDHCPGYGSAARFVALAMYGENLDVASLPGVKIDVVMGRHAGWLTAACALGRQKDGDGPHLVYVPEKVFSPEGFAADVERVHKRLGRCIVAVSEGIHLAGRKLVVDSGIKDSHGNVQLSGSGALGDWLVAYVKKALGPKLRVRADTFGYVQRSFPAAISSVDAREAREVGRTAARAALSGERHSGTVAIVRARSKRYSVSYQAIALDSVAGRTRTMDARYLSGDHDVTPAFLDYVRPLAGELPEPAHLAAHRWRAARARRSAARAPAP